MSASQRLEAVQPGLLYPLVEFERVTGLGRSALRQMRKQGLRVRYVAGRGYILGSDFISHVLEHGKCDKDE